MPTKQAAKAATKVEPGNARVEVKTEAQPAGASCVNCKQAVEYPDFECPKRPGKHQLVAKTYYHGGAAHIHPVQSRRAFSPTLVLRPAVENFDARNQRSVSASGLMVTFANGKYTTTDSEEQYYLDQHNETKVGDEGLAMWRSVYLTKEQQTDIAGAQLKEAQDELENVNRQLREKSTLLEQAQAQAGAGANAA